MNNLRDSRSLLDEETVKLILHSFEQIRGARGFTEDEASKVLDWAAKMEVQYAFLELVKKGLIAPDIRSDGEVIFWPLSPPTLH